MLDHQPHHFQARTVSRLPEGSASVSRVLQDTACVSSVVIILQCYSLKACATARYYMCSGVLLLGDAPEIIQCCGSLSRFAFGMQSALQTCDCKVQSFIVVELRYSGVVHYCCRYLTIQSDLESWSSLPGILNSVCPFA